MRPGLGLVLCAAIIAAAVPAFTAAGQEPAPETSPAAQPDQSSPRATLFSFLDAMNAVRAGNEARLPEALSAIYLQDIPADEREQRGRELVTQLFDILDTITIDPDAIPEEVEGRTLHIELGEENQVPLDFRLNDDGVWRFSRSRLEASVDQVHEEVVERQEEETQDSGANPMLTSPRETMRTFINAFGHWADGGREEAIATFDLSGLDVASDSVRAEVAEERAIQLKQILDRYERIVFQLLPNDPDGSKFTYYVDPADVTGQRVIEIVPIDVEGADVREWKFSGRTVAAIPALWDLFKDRPPVAGVNADTPQLLSLQIRSWVSLNAPFLLDRTVILQNYQWLGLLIVIAVGMVFSRVFAAFLLLVIRRYFRRKDLALDTKLEKGFVRPIRVAIMAWVWYLALRPLGLPPNVLDYLRVAVGALSAVAFVWALYRLVDIVGRYMHQRALATDLKYDDLVVPLVVRTLKIFVIAFGIVFVADVAGKDPTAALAGLGIGGLAFALAAQDTLGNFFGSLTVLMDRPFQIGDWIRIGDVDGSVEEVGIRSTRIRTFYNSVVTVPNSELTTAFIDNYGARAYQRVKSTIGLTYDTQPEKIDAFCEGIRELIRGHPYTRKDYFHVYFNDFGPSSLNVMLYCFLQCPDWGTELRERHRLLVDIVRLAKRVGVEFAFPTQTLHVYREEPVEAEPLAGTPGDAEERGRNEARGIVREFLGPEGIVPPPVEYFDPQQQDADPSD